MTAEILQRLLSGIESLIDSLVNLCPGTLPAEICREYKSVSENYFYQYKAILDQYVEFLRRKATEFPAAEQTYTKLSGIIY